MTDITGGLITLEYAITGLGWAAPSGSTTARDADLTTYVQAATPIIEDLIGPVLQRTGVVQTRPGWKTAVLLDGPIANAAAVTQVKVDGAVVSGWRAVPESGIVFAGYYGVIFAGDVVEVTVTTGYATANMPMNVQLATRELVRHLIMIRDAKPTAGTANIVAGEQPAVIPSGFAVPNRVIELLGNPTGGMA